MFEIENSIKRFGLAIQFNAVREIMRNAEIPFCSIFKPD